MPARSIHYGGRTGLRMSVPHSTFSRHLVRSAMPETSQMILVCDKVLVLSWLQECLIAFLVPRAITPAGAKRSSACLVKRFVLNSARLRSPEIYDGTCLGTFNVPS